MAVSLERRTGAVAFLYWLWEGIDRTIFTGIKFSFPARFVSPFGFLGMLTFIIFVILGISGALLMFYYQPIWIGLGIVYNSSTMKFHLDFISGTFTITVQTLWFSWLFYICITNISVEDTKLETKFCG